MVPKKTVLHQRRKHWRRISHLPVGLVPGAEGYVVVLAGGGLAAGGDGADAQALPLDGRRLQGRVLHPVVQPAEGAEKIFIPFLQQWLRFDFDFILFLRGGDEENLNSTRKDSPGASAVDDRAAGEGRGALEEAHRRVQPPHVLVDLRNMHGIIE